MYFRRGISLLLFYLISEINSELRTSWPWETNTNLRRISNRSNWRSQNILAKISNKNLCEGDFYFLLDSSTSMGEQTFERLKLYVAKVLSMFSPLQVQHGDLKIGLIRFGSRADVISSLQNPYDRNMLGSLQRVPFTGGVSSIVRSFRLLTSMALWQNKSHSIYQELPTRPRYRPRYSFGIRNKFQKVKSVYDDMFPLLDPTRRRLVVVFTDGNFGDSDAGMTLATLGVSCEIYCL